MRQAAQKVEAVDWAAGDGAGSIGRGAGSASRGTGGMGRSRGGQEASAVAVGAHGRGRAATIAGQGRCGRDQRLLDWVESQASVTRIWLDQLIAEGDPQDLISLIHRQAAWLDLMRSRLADS